MLFVIVPLLQKSVVVSGHLFQVTSSKMCPEVSSHCVDISPPPSGLWRYSPLLHREARSVMSLSQCPHFHLTPQLNNRFVSNLEFFTNSPLHFTHAFMNDPTEALSSPVYFLWNSSAQTGSVSICMPQTYWYCFLFINSLVIFTCLSHLPYRILHSIIQVKGSFKCVMLFRPWPLRPSLGNLVGRMSTQLFIIKNEKVYILLVWYFL